MIDIQIVLIYARSHGEFENSRSIRVALAAIDTSKLSESLSAIALPADADSKNTMKSELDDEGDENDVAADAPLHINGDGQGKSDKTPKRKRFDVKPLATILPFDKPPAYHIAKLTTDAFKILLSALPANFVDRDHLGDVLRAINYTLYSWQRFASTLGKDDKFVKQVDEMSSSAACPRKGCARPPLLSARVAGRSTTP